MRYLIPALLVGVVAGTVQTHAAPDLIAGDITSPAQFGSSGGVTAYAFGHVMCNIGTAPATVISSTNQHPLTTENLFRYSVVDGAGRMVQVGQGWCFHHFCEVQQSLCGTCQPFGSGCAAGLGVLCSSPTSASNMGGQSFLGPRWQVNAQTGAFVYPPPLPGGGVLAGRLQVAQSDLDPSMQVAPVYFAEQVMVAPDDALAGRNNNNASHRRVLVGGFVAGGWALSVSGSTVRESPAIEAWLALDPGNTAGAASTAPGFGRVYVVSSATDLGGGVWQYEYGVYNLNADRAVGGFSVPVPATAALSQIGYTDVEYHSAGNPYSNEVWLGVRSGGMLTWSCDSFGTNPNANAIRWGTMYNFRFRANMPPTSGEVTLAAFKPGTPASFTVPGMKVPKAPPPACFGDANGDGLTNGADLSVLLGQFGQTVSPGSDADFNGDGEVNGADLSVLLSNFGCPG